MWKKVAIAGCVAAGILGVGTAALAVSDSGSLAPSASSSTAGQQHPGLAKLGKRGVHGQIVTRGDGTSFVTHDFIRGEVTAVSPTAISVKAADGVTEKFVVNGDTKVRIRKSGSGTAGTIDAVHTGAKVLVTGTGTDPLTALHIVVQG